MNGNSGSGGSIAVIIGGGLLMLYIAASVMLSGGNTMGSMFFYMLIFSGVFALLAPRLAFFLFILQCGYLDLAKRLMIMGGSVSLTDLYWVLGIAPVTVAGITAALVFRVLFGQLRADRSDVMRFGIACGVMAIGAVAAYKGGGGVGGVLKSVADNYFYLILVFVAPLLFPTALDVRRVWGFIFTAFVPVALYGIYQQVYGFQEFELEYLRTGLSIEIKQLTTDRVRAFGTLNSPTSLSLVMGELAAMALLLAGIRHCDARLGLRLPSALLLTVLFLGAWLASTVRVGILVVPVALMASWLFRSRGSTIVFYSMGLLAFAGLIASSDYMLVHIEGWTARLHDWTGQQYFLANLLDANTYKDRLMGFANVLGNPAAYTLFGKDGADTSGEFYNHDPLSSALLKVGALPLGFGLIAIGMLVAFLHRTTWEIQDQPSRRLAIACLAVAAGSVAVSMVGGNLMSTFPGNAFLALPIGMIIALHRSDRRASSLAAVKPPRQTAGAPHRRVASPWTSPRAPWQPAAGRSKSTH